VLPHARLTRLRRRVFWCAVGAYGVTLPLILAFAFGLHVESASLEPVSETATLEISTVPDGADVSVSGGKPRPSPAVFDGLAAGAVEFTVSAKGAGTWRGVVRTEPGLAFSVAQLRMVSVDGPRQIATLAVGSGPVLFHEGRSVAYVPAGESTVSLVTFATDGVNVERIPFPRSTLGTAATLTLLEMSDQLLISGRASADAYVVDLGGLASVGAGRRTAHAVRLPPSAIAVLSVGMGDATVDAVEMGGIARYSGAGGAKRLLDLGGSLVASGYVHGRWYLMDDRGGLYQQGHLLPPSRIADLGLGGCGDCLSSGRMHVLLAADDLAACLAPERRRLLVFAPKRDVRTYEGIDGGSAAEEHARLWLWRGGELLVSFEGEKPYVVARLEGSIVRVQEEFAPRHAAVETDAGVYLLPSPAVWDGRVTLEPLLLVANAAGVHTVACRDGVLIGMELETGTARVYRATWYRE